MAEPAVVMYLWSACDCLDPTASPLAARPASPLERAWLLLVPRAACAGAAVAAAADLLVPVRVQAVARSLRAWPRHEVDEGQYHEHRKRHGGLQEEGCDQTPVEQAAWSDHVRVEGKHAVDVEDPSEHVRPFDIDI
eukprot:scaffold6021_cov379-Prasinococcus_capsulatus_cf.AAC.6